jgi:hypothetical protein
VFGELQARRSKLKDALMFKNALIVALAALMVAPLQGGQQTSATVQDEVAKLTKGSMIEVKLKSRKKVNGRLGEVSADGFEVQVSQGQKADNVNLPFANVDWVAAKTPAKGSHKAVWIVVGVGVGVVVVMTILGAVVAFR